MTYSHYFHLGFHVYKLYFKTMLPVIRLIINNLKYWVFFLEMWFLKPHKISQASLLLLQHFCSNNCANKEQLKDQNFSIDKKLILLQPWCSCIATVVKLEDNIFKGYWLQSIEATRKLTYPATTSFYLDNYIHVL